MKNIWFRRIVFSILMSLVFVMLLLTGIFDRIQLAGYDSLLASVSSKFREEPRLVALELDEGTFATWNAFYHDSEYADEISREAYFRRMLAGVITRLSELGASVIGLDINLEKTSDSESDRLLAEAIKNSERVVLSREIKYDEEYGFSMLSELSEDFKGISAHYGVNDLKPDRDDVMRKYSAGMVPILSSPRVLEPSFASAVYSVFRGLDGKGIIPVDEAFNILETLEDEESDPAVLLTYDVPGRVLGNLFFDDRYFFMNFREPSSINTISLRDIYPADDAVPEEEKNRLQGIFEGAIVLIGDTVGSESPRFRSSLDNADKDTPALFYHAGGLLTIMDAEETGAFITKIPLLSRFFGFLAIFFLMSILMDKLGIYGGVIAAILLGAAHYFISSRLMLSGVWFDYTVPSFALLAAVILGLKHSAAALRKIVDYIKEYMSRFTKKPLFFVFAVWLFFMLLSAADLLLLFERLGYDFLMEIKSTDLPAETRVTILEDDDATYEEWNDDPDYQEEREKYGPVGFKRLMMARTIRKLKEFGASVVALDYIIQDSSHPYCDKEYADAIEEFGSVILANNLNKDLWRAELNPEIADHAAGTGIINIAEDKDGIFRRYSLYHSGIDSNGRKGLHLPSFATALYETYGKSESSTLRNTTEDGFFVRSDVEDYKDHQVKLAGKNWDWHKQYMINFRSRSRISTMSLRTVTGRSLPYQIENDPDYIENNFLDRIFIIGTTQASSQDFYRSPIEHARTVPGVHFHAHAFLTLLDADSRGSFIKRISGFYWALIMLAGGLGGAVILRKMKPLAGAIILLVISIALFYISEQLFLRDIWFDFTVPVLYLITIFVADVAIKFIAEKREKDKIRGAFTNYVNPDLVSLILKDPSKLRLGGDKLDLTVLFSDIAGFTTMSEMLAPEKLVELLNEYLNDMTEIVLDSHGLLDKFIGDAVMAVWGAPLPMEDHAVKGVETALQMIERLTILQEKWREEGWPEVDIRIGLNTGDMIAGNMGCEKRKDYTVIGDAVNLGARLEGINKQYGTRITISEFTHARIGDHFVTRQTDSVRVKGKKEPVRIFEVVGRTGEVPDTRLEQLKLFKEGYQLYLEQKWDEAIETFHRAHELMPSDKCCKLFISRCEAFKEDSPGEDWDGVCTMTTK